MEIDCWIDPGRALGPQVAALVDGVGLSPQGWQMTPLLVNLPSLNYVAATLLAELQGRCGYLPTCLRWRPAATAGPVRFELAEALPLQAIRTAARRRR